MRGRLLVPLAVAVVVALASKQHRHRGPIIELNGAEQLVGTLREDELVLNTVPQLAIASESGPVCEYEITGENGELVPFEVEVTDRYTGVAIIRVKDATTLDCKKPTYDLKIAAVKCDENVKSEQVPLKVTVKDTNNHEPVFEHSWYTASVVEGKLHNEIVRVSATDADCGHPYGEICEYEISNGLDKGTPFEISKQGVISNTRPLNYSDAHSYIVTVVAHDCGQRKSKSALVTIKVAQACVEGIQGVSDRLPYEATAGSMKLFPELVLKTCAEDSQCTVSSVSAQVDLHTTHVEDACGREDTPLYTNESIKSCGLSKNAVRLLEDTQEFAGSRDEELIKSTEATSLARIVPVDTFDGLLADKFALSFSMKHARGSHDEQKSKQHVLCESDEKGMNRHHFSVYVRHCKLEVVLRRENGAKEEFAAAEWRWNMSEVCDDKWHSYSVLFNGVDNVELVVDGAAFKHDERNPEILDDWPLHKTSNVKTRLVVGACWHGRSLALAQFFKGSLGHVFLLAGSSEPTKAVECAHACPERLVAGAEDASIKSDATSVKLVAKTSDELQKKLRELSYSNSRVAPLPGHRGVRVQVSVECAEQGKTITLPEYKGYVFVKRHADPAISISGQAVVEADQKALRIGTPMLPGLRITVSQTDEDGQVKDVTAESKVDFCKVHLKPSRDMDLEYFSSPATLIASTKIDFEHDKQGMLLRGADWAATYTEVLEKIHYFNTRPDAYSKRIYAVQCAMEQGRVLSNEFIVTMSIEPSPAESVPLDDTSSEELARHFEPAFDQLGGARLQNVMELELPRPKALLSHHGYDMGQGAVAGGAVAVVVVVCVGFLLVLLVVGVLKMRDTPIPKRHRRNRKSQDGMEWDDAGMNITVNPLDDVEKSVGGRTASFSEEDESDDDDSECSYHEEDEEMSEEDEDEDTEVLPLNHQAPHLEWDDEEAHEPSSPSSSRTPSTPSVPRPPSSARSYRV